ncbi:hypothetical protein CEY00_Acc29649 [Actinidia chinensis var. chinensis]|uniref:Uncharacterized protein n=1 Tax=Actinidia chinensis var. chinensis TaxID=1590841 RepID=A0A2R6PDI2_ACTCC|nr:hypothetical protein CEY00_Acc29649 [Actinidia chinensis var. chinensis]
MTKRTYPTMKRRKRRRPQLGAEETLNKLLQQYKNLQQDWKTFKKSSQSPIAKKLSLVENSPRSHMSSLQHRVRSNDAAREEILRDRKAAIESGKLKGRRLFGPVEGGSEVGFGEREEACSEVRSMCSYECDGENEDCGGEGEVVSSGGCYCGSGSGLCEEREEGGELVMVVGGEKVRVGGEVEREECGRGNGGGRGMFLMGWLAFALMVLTMGIIYKRCNGGYSDEDDVMLVPT